MVVISYAGKEANAKIVYYGPGLGGKTTNLEFIYDSVPSSSRGKMVSMKTQTDRTLFFDFLPLDLGELGGFRTRFLLYTVPGQVFYNATRKLVLRGADAIAFIADSQVGKMDENKDSLANLEENLAEYDLSLDSVPWVIQYNKRDMPEVYSIDELNRELNARNVPYFEGIATEGVGVFETFRGLSKLLLEKLSEEIGQRLVMAKQKGPKTEDQRAKAVEKILMGPLTEHVEIPTVGKPAEEPAEAYEAAQPAEAAPAAGVYEPVEAVDELKPQTAGIDERTELVPEAQAAGQYAAGPAPWEGESEPEGAVLEELDLTPEADLGPLAEVDESDAGSEVAELATPESRASGPSSPDVNLVREGGAVPNFFGRASGSARLELERDTAHFAEAHDYARDGAEPQAGATPEVELRAPEPVAKQQPVSRREPVAPSESVARPELVVKQEPVVRFEPAARVESARVSERATQMTEEPLDEEISFLNIIRRNNVGVFEKSVVRQEAAPSPKPALSVEAPSEKRGIESSIEIPLPLRQGENMQEVTLTIRIRLKPVAQASGAADHDFILEGISR